MSKWSQDVKTKWHPGEGIFEKSADEIAKLAKSGHSGDIGASIKALQFHINRAGKNMKDETKGRIKHAIKILQKKNEGNMKKRLESRFNLDDEFIDIEDSNDDEFYGSVADENEERELARRHINRHAGLPNQPQFAERYKSKFGKVNESARSKKLTSALDNINRLMRKYKTNVLNIENTVTNVATDCRF